jgi:hypothetical protein
LIAFVRRLEDRVNIFASLRANRMLMEQDEMILACRLDVAHCVEIRHTLNRDVLPGQLGLVHYFWMGVH